MNPMITMDTYFQTFRRLAEPHTRLDYFTMDLDLKNVPEEIIKESQHPNYEDFADVVFELIKAYDIPSLLLMFKSGSNRGVKLVFKSEVKDLKKLYQQCVNLIDDAVNYKLSQHKGVYDEAASCVITTPINIHKSSKIYYNKYATHFVDYKKETPREIKDLAKVYSSFESKYMSEYNKKEQKYKSGLHSQLFAFASALNKRGVPVEFIKDKIISDWGHINYNDNPNDPMKVRLENNIFKYALKGVLEKNIKYELKVEK
jgi:hypothetical protein